MEAVKEQAQALVLPEYLTTSLEDDSDYIHWLQVDLTSFLRTEAIAHKLWVVGGTHPLPVSAGSPEHFNHAFIVSPQGNLFLQPKIHLLPSEKIQSPKTVGGNELHVFEIDGIRCAVLICYDIEFPELCRKAVLEQNVELVFVPSWTATEAGFSRVRYCALARAIENQIFVVQAPLVGKLDRFGVWEEAFGRAGIFAPCDAGFPASGILAEGRNNVTDVVVANLSFTRLAKCMNQGQVATRHDAKLKLSEKIKILPQY